MAKADWDSVAAQMMHPTAYYAIKRMAQRQCSAALLARELSQPIANVAYHVAKLSKDGIIYPVKRVQRRGAVETYYSLMPEFLQ